MWETQEGTVQALKTSHKCRAWQVSSGEGEIFNHGDSICFLLQSLWLVQSLFIQSPTCKCHGLYIKL